MERSPRGGSRLPIGAGRLQYKLDGDSAHTRVFGDATNSTVGGHGLIALNVLGLDPTATLDIHGRVFGSQTTVTPGAYADSWRSR